jgi:uroporphyrinogen-III synthase
MAVLVTRPRPGAEETARRLIAMGVEPVVAPVTAVVPLALRLPPAAAMQAVLVTSANALAALGPLGGVRLLAVGDATAARAREAGFDRVESAGGDAEALARLASQRCDPAGGPLLLAGQQGQGRRLARRLRAAGFTVQHRSVYAVRRVPELPAAARTALLEHRVSAVLFFSPGTARAFVGLAAALPLVSFAGVDSLAISPAAAAVLRALPWQRIRVAPAPNQNELLGLLP